MKNWIETQWNPVLIRLLPFHSSTKWLFTPRLNYPVSKKGENKCAGKDFNLSTVVETDDGIWQEVTRWLWRVLVCTKVECGIWLNNQNQKHLYFTEANYTWNCHVDSYYSFIRHIPLRRMYELRNVGECSLWIFVNILSFTVRISKIVIIISAG